MKDKLYIKVWNLGMIHELRYELKSVSLLLRALTFQLKSEKKLMIIE